MVLRFCCRGGPMCLPKLYVIHDNKELANEVPALMVGIYMLLLNI